jgi:hypothetical protein
MKDIFTDDGYTPGKTSKPSTTKKAPKKYADPIRNEKCTACKKSLAKGYTIVTLKHKHNISGNAVKGHSESSTCGELELPTCGELKCMVGALKKIHNDN